MSFDATTWVENLGFLKSFGIYSGALGITALGLPLVYFYGKKIRAFTAGNLGANTAPVARSGGAQDRIGVHVEVSSEFKGFGKV